MCKKKMKRFFQQCLSFMMTLTILTGLLPGSVSAFGNRPGSHPGDSSGNSSGNTSVDHIDIGVDLTATIFIEGVAQQAEFTITTDDAKYVTITAHPSDTSFSLSGGVSTSTDNSGKKQIRIEGDFPVGTESDPISYTVTLSKTITTTSGHSVPVTLNTTMHYWDGGNVCPGFQQKPGNQSGIDLNLNNSASSSSTKGTIQIQKTIVGGELTNDKTFLFDLLDENGTVCHDNIAVTVPAGANIASTIISNVDLGSYTIREDLTEAAIDGYTLSSTSYSNNALATISSSNNNSIINVTNNYTSVLPAKITYYTNFSTNTFCETSCEPGENHSSLDYQDTELPYREGYIFKGWSTSQAGPVEYLPNDTFLVVGNVALYAVWEEAPAPEPAEHLLSYVYAGEIPAAAPSVPESAKIVTGEVVSLAASPSVQGYTFSGWTSNDITVIDDSFIMPDKDVIITGTWSKIIYNPINSGIGNFDIEVIAPDGTPLPGAHFILTSATGSSKTCITNDSGNGSLSNLAVGEYTLVEASAPEGYQKDEREWTVVVEEDYTTKIEEQNEESDLWTILWKWAVSVFTDGENLLVNDVLPVINTPIPSNPEPDEPITPPTDTPDDNDEPENNEDEPLPEVTPPTDTPPSDEETNPPVEDPVPETPPSTPDDGSTDFEDQEPDPEDTPSEPSEPTNPEAPEDPTEPPASEPEPDESTTPPTEPEGDEPTPPVEPTPDDTPSDSTPSLPKAETPRISFVNLIMSSTLSNGAPRVSIEANEYRGRRLLRTVTIPETVTEIGNNAFAECLDLNTIVLKNRSDTSGMMLGYNWNGGASVVFSVARPSSIETEEEDTAFPTEDELPVVPEEDDDTLDDGPDADSVESETNDEDAAATAPDSVEIPEENQLPTEESSHSNGSKPLIGVDFADEDNKTTTDLPIDESIEQEPTETVIPEDEIQEDLSSADNTAETEPDGSPDDSEAPSDEETSSDTLPDADGITSDEPSSEDIKTEETLPHTGIMWWPIPLMFILGIILLIIGISSKEKGE